MQTQNGLAPHPSVLDKNLRGISQEQEVLASHQAPSAGLQFQVLSQWKKLWEPHTILLKELTYRLTYSDLLPLSSSTQVAA